MNATIVRVAVIAAFATLALEGCHRDTGEQTVGQRLDNAIDHTQEKLTQAGKNIDQKLASAGEKTQQKLAETGDKLSKATDNAISSVKETTASATTTSGGKPLSDTAITASIKTDFLKDPDLSVLKIDVDTKDGVVTLNGLAGDEAARGRAEKMASAIKGVREVRNFLVIKRA